MKREDGLTLLESALNEPNGSIDETTRLESLDGWDSVGMLSVMALVDSHLGVVLPPEEISRSDSAGDLLNLVKDKFE
jgi:acyl carrier protein